MKTILDECTLELQRSIDRFPWTQHHSYADWLTQTYHYVRHSTRLLAAAAARFALDERGDALHQRFSAHMGEEKRHELLAAHDLKALGFALADFDERHCTRLMYEPQYYKIEHQDPIVLFGYILPLEAMAAISGRAVLSRLLETYGAAATTFLKVHAEDDVDHVQKALATLEGSTPTQRAQIETNLRQSTYCYTTLLREIQQQPIRTAKE